MNHREDTHSLAKLVAIYLRDFSIGRKFIKLRVSMISQRGENDVFGLYIKMKAFVLMREFNTRLTADIN